MESASWKILEGCAPAHWIIREVTERDYGIDAYMEIPTLEGEITGELCSIQLKGSNTIEWKEKEGEKIATFSGVDKTTVNYWMGLPIPVFLIWADLGAHKAYFASVKPQVRNQYGKYIDERQKTLSFYVLPNCELGTQEGNYSFLWLYFMEKNFAEFRNRARGILIHLEEYNEFLIGNQGRDEFLGVEEDRQLMIIHIYESCKFLSDYLGMQWDVTDLNQIYKEDEKTFGRDYYVLHEMFLEKISRELRVVFIKTVEKLKVLISERQSDYWLATDLRLYNVSRNLNLEWTKRYL
jgi:hypothetical protein